MSKPWFKCCAAQGYVRFSDGTRMHTPPRSHAEKLELLSKISEIKKPECRTCGAVMKPHVLKSGKSKGQIKFICEDCNAAQILARQYRGMSEAELEGKLTDAHTTLRRRQMALHIAHNRLKKEQNSGK